MSAAVLAVILAVLAPGGLLVVLLERLRRENHRDHGTVHQKLDRITERIDDHIEWHLKGPKND